MNVLILSDLIAYSGVGQYMIDLGNELTKQKEIGTVVLASPEILREDIPKTLLVESLIELNNYNIIKYVKAIHKIVKKYRITVVHCNHRRQSFIMRIYQMLYGKIAVVWTCHTVPYPTNFIKRILGYYGHKAIAISSEAEEWMLDTLKIKKSHLEKVLNGIDNSSLIIPNEPKSNLKEKFFKSLFNENIDGNKTKIIVAHGRLHPVKGLDLIVKALSQLTESELTDLKVIMSGNTDTSYYEELQSLINRYQLEKNFYFTGWINSVDILSIADLMIQPSHREGFLLSALEAFFMKVPVIRTKVGGYKDMKKICIGIPTNDENAIVYAIRDWMEDPKKFESLTQRAYEFAEKEGSVNTMCRKTLDVYNNAIMSL